MALPPAPKIPPSVDDLIELYQKAQRELINQIIELSNNSNISTARYKAAVLARTQKILAKLKKQTDQWVEENAEAFYKQGISEADQAVLEQYIESKTEPPPFPAQFTVIDQEAVNVLSSQIKFNFDNILEVTGDRIKAELDQAISDAFASKIITGQTLKDVQSQILAILETKGISSFSYTRSDGKIVNMSLSSYAKTLARSTMANITNTASINRTQQVGGDLVKMTSHATSCPICWPLQGRVYSISGKDPRYPPLDRAFSGGYANIHPNCRHRINPYIPALKSPAELAKDLAFSNRSFEVDGMSKSMQRLFNKNLDIYNKGQEKTRKLRADGLQWQRYRARLGDDAPKTFSAFRRIKNANGDRWKELQLQYRKAGQPDE